MAPSNRTRVGEALDLLRDGLLPYFRQLIISNFKEDAWQYAVQNSDRYGSGDDNLDLSRLINIFHDYRNDLFKDALGNTGLNLMHEAQEIRNRWAHQEQFSTPDTLRALDTIARLLELVNAPDEHEKVSRSHELVMRSLYSEQARQETRKITRNLKAQGSASLIPWREIATPHEDVRTGNLKQAEFAADLDQVFQGKAGPEYQDPKSFFQRTYLTEGLTDLLISAINRLHGTGGDPVLELQTNFGGGKTHSMIALYHLGGGLDPKTLSGFEEASESLANTDPIHVQRAVLVGTKLSPNQVRDKGNGIVVHTLWGELAYQLAGERGYRLIEASDISGLAPGARDLQAVFELAGPSLILIDEWVAFIRPLYYVGDRIPVAGSFDANLTFAQNLTEAVMSTPQILLAASLPSSDAEAGGQGGQEALRILKHTFSRVKAPWRAATPNEGFEIVRRRLFQDITDFRKRDGTIQMYLEMYRNNQAQFPTDVQQADYRKRMEVAYPFHPETFDLLFGVWGSLETFQRTRGVLRLMANVIHILWKREDSSSLIMPANIPLDATGVVTELGSYLPESWSSVIEHDIDGDQALSLVLDQENTNFDKVSATRRVARTIFMGSAPTFRSDNRGIDDREIRLGVVQPGERPEIFGDALRALANRATYLYSEHGRYWFSTQASVNQQAQERLARLPQEEIDHHIVELLQKHQKPRGIFDRVHVAANGSSDIVDTPEATLVLLGPQYTYARTEREKSKAIIAANNILDTRGEGRRQHRNALIFLAPDHTRLDDLRRAVGQHIVWSEIVASQESLNLDAQQARQATSQAEEAANTVGLRIRDTWCWLIAPRSDPEPTAPVEWDSQQLRSTSKSDPEPEALVEWDSQQLRSTSKDETLAQAASKRAIQEEIVVDQLAGTMLRRAIDGLPVFQNGWTDILIRDLIDWFANYLYLQRVQNSQVIEKAILDGVSSMLWETETFAYADAWDEKTDRYLGLTAGPSKVPLINLRGQAVLVHPSVAKKQFEEDRRREQKAAAQPGDYSANLLNLTPDAYIADSPTEVDAPAAIDTKRADQQVPQARRYFGTVTLNPQTLTSQVSEISNEIVSHLSSIYGADVTVSLEINVNVPDGVPLETRKKIEQVAKDLRFDQSDFVEE